MLGACQSSHRFFGPDYVPPDYIRRDAEEARRFAIFEVADVAEAIEKVSRPAAAPAHPRSPQKRR